MRQGPKARGIDWALASVLASAIVVHSPSPVAAAAAAEPPAPAVGAPAKSEQHAPKVAYVVFGLAGSAAVVGTIFGVKALRAKDSFDGGDRTTDRVESIEKNALLADMAFGAALTLGITGVVLWLSRYDDASGLATDVPHRPTMVVSPTVLSSVPGAVAILHF